MAKKENAIVAAALELRAIGDVVDLRNKLASLALHAGAPRGGRQVPARTAAPRAALRRIPEPQ